MMNDSDSVVPSDTSMNSGNELIVGWKAAPQGNRGKALMGTLSASSNKVIILLLVVSVILLLFGTASVSKENTIKLESEVRFRTYLSHLSFDSTVQNLTILLRSHSLAVLYKCRPDFAALSHDTSRPTFGSGLIQYCLNVVRP